MKVLVALDESQISLRAAREAVRLFPGAEFTVVTVNRRPVPWIMQGPYGGTYFTTFVDLPPEGLDDETLTGLAASAGITDAETVTAIGDPAYAICQAAEQHDADVVVVGSHDKGLLGRLFAPSIAHAVVTGTFRPVLVVSGTRPPVADPESSHSAAGRSGERDDVAPSANR
jgi:nucleotide-binding universal stress UspA family protein